MSEWLKGWLASEETSHDKIEAKRIYIDLNEGNLYDGVIFSQIMYWHGASRETGKPRMTIEKEGNLWLAKGYGDWFVECRIGEATARQCISRIEKRGLIVKKLWKFNKTPTVHLRIDWDNLEEQLKWICYDTSIGFDTTYQIRFDTTYQMDLIPHIKSITDTTPDITTETKSKEKTPRKPKWFDEDQLIDVWAGIRKLDAIAMGADYHTDQDRRILKKLLGWSKPLTADEIREAMRRSKHLAYPISYLEKDVIALRSEKPATINPAHVPFPSTDEPLDIVPMPPEAIEARQLLARAMSDKEGIKYAKPA